MLLNKILRLLGLMTIKRARYIFRIFHVEYENWILNEAVQDFNAPIKPLWKETAAAYADNVFESIIKEDHPQVQIRIGADNYIYVPRVGLTTIRPDSDGDSDPKDLPEDEEIGTVCPHCKGSLVDPNDYSHICPHCKATGQAKRPDPLNADGD